MVRAYLNGEPPAGGREMTVIDRSRLRAGIDSGDRAVPLPCTLGFAVGKVRVWKISLGGVAGTLVPWRS